MTVKAKHADPKLKDEKKKDDPVKLLLRDVCECTFNGQLEKALQLISKAVELEPKQDDILLTKAIILSKLGRHDEALEYFDKALKIKPDYLLAHLKKGASLVELKKYEDALKCFDKALELSPNNAGVLEYKGLAFIYLERYEEAISCYKQVLEKEPANMNALANIGSLLSMQPDHIIDALPYLTKALDVDPDNPAVLVIVAQALGKLGRFEEAEMLFNRLARMMEKENKQTEKKSGLPPIFQ